MGSTAAISMGVHSTAEIEQPDETDAIKIRAAFQLEKLQAISNNHLNAYERGQITLERLLEDVAGALNAATDAWGIDRNKVLRHVLEEVLAVTPPSFKKGPRGEPLWIRYQSLDLIKTAQHRKYSVNPATAAKRKDGLSAFDIVAEKWRSVGLQITPGQVRKWYNNRRKIESEYHKVTLVSR